MKSVLITGCSSGIGLCLAKGLQKKGYQIFATARSDTDVEKLKNLGLDAYQLDLSSSTSIQRAMSYVYEKVDHLYGLIHNGAYGQVGALEDISRQTLEAQFQTNVFGWHELTNLVLTKMKANNQGRIIYLSSVVGFVAMPFRGSYSASKFAIEGLVDTLRLELSNTNIQLALIQPGPIESKFRINAYQAFKRNVDMGASDYQHSYQNMIKRLNSDKLAAYTLPAEAILKCTLHALEAKNAKIHYWVTFPTKLFAVLKRILPTRIMDKILSKVSSGGKR